MRKGHKIEDISNMGQNKGKHWKLSEITKEKMRNKVFTDLHRQNLSKSGKGRISWNKGLTKETDERLLNSSNKMKNVIVWNKGLTKGTDERVKKTSETISKNHPLKGKKYVEVFGFEKTKIILDKQSFSAKNRLPRERWKVEDTSKYVESRKFKVCPKKDTSIEVKLQNYLKQLQIEFLTHQYMHIEHGYQCDIIIPSKNLVIECDGNYWHSYPIGKEVDRIRTSELIEKGFKVLRLWEFEINKMSIDEFKEKLK